METNLEASAASAAELGTAAAADEIGSAYLAAISSGTADGAQQREWSPPPLRAPAGAGDSVVVAESPTSSPIAPVPAGPADAGPSAGAPAPAVADAVHESGATP